MRFSFKLWPKWLKYSAALAGVVFVLSAGIFSWVNYLSPEAKNIRAQRKDVETILKMQRNYEEAMRADTYGGKTPQETLSMFADAIKSGNVDLAVRYLKFDDTGKSDRELETGLRKAVQEGKTNLILQIIREAELDPQSSDNNTAWFVVVGKDGLVEHSVVLSLNRYTNLWKLENM
jgi:hypothetical protein